MGRRGRSVCRSRGLFRLCVFPLPIAYCLLPFPYHRPLTSEASSRTTGVVMVLLTLAGWTVTPLLIKYFADPKLHIDGWTSNGWRYGFAALLWSPALLLAWRRGTLPKRIWVAALFPAAVNSAAQVAFTWAHYMIDPGLIAFGLRVQIICVAVAAAILFPVERLVIRKPGFIAGLLLVLLGTAGTIGAAEGFGAAGATTRGVVLAMLAGAGYAFYAVGVRHFMHGVSSILAFAVISQYTAATQIVLMLVFGANHGANALSLPPDIFALFFLSSVIGIALGHVFYYISIARLGVALSTGVIQLQPFTVAVLSFVWFGEALTIAQWGAGTVAVFGAIVMLWTQHVVLSRMRRAHAEREELPVDHVAAAAEAEGERVRP